MFRKLILILMVVIGTAAIGSLFFRQLFFSRRNLNSCFDDAQGLRPGATVRIAGVDVGTVQSVRAAPQNRKCPAQVDMFLATPYELQVPKDAVAEISQAGVLGGMFVSIDIAQASGPPIENYGYLRSKPAPSTAPMDPHKMDNLLKALDAILAKIKASPEGETPQDDSASLPATPKR